MKDVRCAGSIGYCESSFVRIDGTSLTVSESSSLSSRILSVIDTFSSVATAGSLE
jgi:hypothetical protein